MPPKKRKPTNPAQPWRVLAQGPGGAVVDVTTQGSDFDEVCVGGWFHLERMDTREWCLILNDSPGPDGKASGRHANIAITVRRDGTLKVTVVDDGDGMIEGLK